MINLPPHLAKLSATLNPTPMMNYTTKQSSSDLNCQSLNKGKMI